MPKPPPSVDIRRAGLLVAVALGLISAGGLGLMVVRARQRGAPPAPATGPLLPEAPPTDIAAAGGAPSGIPGLASAKRGRVQLLGRDDRTKVRGNIEWQTLDPLPGGRAAVVQPRATLALGDGLVLVLRSAAGELTWPSEEATGAGQEPEAGTFTGGVKVAIYEAGDAAPDLATLDLAGRLPLALIVTDSVEFDLALGLLETSDEFRASGPRFDLRGAGISIVYNEVAGRIERLEIQRTAFARFFPDTPDAAAPPSRAASPDAPPAATAGAAPNPEPFGPPAPQTETIYHADFQDAVVLTYDGRHISAGSLDLWARLLDNQLPRDAFGPESAQPAAAPAQASSAASPDLAPPDLAPPGLPPPDAAPSPAPPFDLAATTIESSLAPAGGQPAELTWAGPFRLVPLPAAPETLRENHVALRFHAASAAAPSPAGVDSADSPALVDSAAETAPAAPSAPPAPAAVVFADPARGFDGVAATLDVGATRREFGLRGLPALPGDTDSAPGVRLTAAQAGTLECERLVLHLPSGVGQVQGPGALTPAAEGDTSLAWSEQADFQFFMIGGEMTQDLQRVDLAGSVVARSGPSTRVSGEVASASFALHPQGGSFLTVVTVGGGAQAAAGEGASLEADHIELSFEPPDDPRAAPQPNLLVATGDVLASDGATSLGAQRLEAALVPDAAPAAAPDSSTPPTPRVRVDTVVADGDVHILGDRGLAVRANHLEANVPEQRAVLTDGVTLARDGGIVSGEQVRLWGDRRAAEFFGPGTLTFQAPAEADAAPSDAPPQRLTASWTQSMAFDDAAGVADFRGEAAALATREQASGDLQLDRIEGDRIRLEFTPRPTAPAPTAEADVPPPAGAPSPAPARALVRADVYGRSLEEENAPPARLTSRRLGPFAADAPPGATDDARPVLQLLYLSGDRVTLADGGLSFVVPGAGTLLVDDRRGPAEATPAPNAPGATIAPSQGPGTSVFTWAGSLAVARPAPPSSAETVLQFSQDVQLIHQPRGGDARFVLDCTTLTAWLAPAGSPPQPPAGSPAAAPDPASAMALSRAEARGDVVARALPDRRELRADTLQFDAPANVVVASAGPEDQQRVSVVEPDRPGALQAKQLRWSLTTGRIDVIQPLPVTAPVGR